MLRFVPCPSPTSAHPLAAGTQWQVGVVIEAAGPLLLEWGSDSGSGVIVLTSLGRYRNTVNHTSHKFLDASNRCGVVGEDTVRDAKHLWSF